MQSKNGLKTDTWGKNDHDVG